MEAFWTIVINNSLAVCVFAGFALVLGRVWKNPAALHLVWIAVVLKLFLPPLYVLPVPGTAGLRSSQDIARLIPAADAVVGKQIAQAARTTNTTEPTSIPAPKRTAASEVAAGTAQATAFAAESWLRSPAAFGAAAWLFGTIVIGCGYAARVLQFERLLRSARPANADLVASVKRLGQQLSLRRVPDVFTIGVPLPPLVWSMLGRPRVILPAALLARLDRDAVELILAHELAHVKRRDHWVRWLELAATAVFWWHPVAWFGSAKLREFEEQCCDARVVGAAPHSARQYAVALLDVLDYLSEQSPLAVPLPTAASAGSLARRIRMLREAQSYQLSVAGLLLVTAIAAGPLAIALAAEEPKAETRAAVINGHVANEAGEALADVRIIVAVPATDMRFVHRGTEHKTFETRTDANGDYELELTEITKPTNVSLDATKPGYRTLAGTLMQGGDARKFEVVPSKTTTQSLSLPLAEYVKGTVVDASGKPIAGVQINATLAFDRSSGGIQITASEDDGAFEIFNYPRPPFAEKEFEGAEALLHLSHPDYVAYRANDLYALSPDQRDNLQIVLDAGHRIRGRVLDASGQSVAGVMVEAMQEGYRKAVLTDAQGNFNLRGLIEGDTEVRAHATPLKQKGKTTIELSRDFNNVELRLQPIVLAEEPKKVKVLGMTLTDVTPELVATYDLRLPDGALILDPGKDSDRLKIGELVEGFTFIFAGDTRVANVREFLQRLLESAEDPIVNNRFRVVYLFHDLENTGTNSQRLKPTEEDLREIRKVLDDLEKE